MWFFDSVLEETPKEVINKEATPVASAQKDDQDGSFLIISDDMAATNLPDTAVQIFETTPPNTEVKDTIPGMSFFWSENNTVSDTQTEVNSENTESSSEHSFLSSTINENKDVTWGQDEMIVSLDVATDEWWVMTKKADTPVIMEENVATLFGGISWETLTSTESTPTTPTLDKNDIYAPMKRAIAEYEEFIGILTKDAEEKDQEIVNYNEEIAEAKRIAKVAIDKAQASVKKALEKRKSLDAEIKRIQEMSSLLAWQIK
jgi:hypothetical protein